MWTQNAAFKTNFSCAKISQGRASAATLYHSRRSLPLTQAIPLQATLRQDLLPTQSTAGPNILASPKKQLRQEKLILLFANQRRSTHGSSSGNKANARNNIQRPRQHPQQEAAPNRKVQNARRLYFLASEQQKSTRRRSAPKPPTSIGLNQKRQRNFLRPPRLHHRQQRQHHHALQHLPRLWRKRRPQGFT